MKQALANNLPQFSFDDKRAVDIWERSVEVVERHYQLDIPFKSKLPNLPDNRSVAEKSRWPIGSRKTPSYTPSTRVEFKNYLIRVMQRKYLTRR